MHTLQPKPGVIAEYLRRMPLFEGLGGPRLDRLGARSSLRLYDRGDRLFTEGETARELFWVAHGAVRVFRTLPDGREKVIHLLPAPSLVAEVPALLGEAWPASAECTEPSTIVAVERRLLAEEVRADPEVSLRLLAASLGRLRELTRSLAETAQLSATARVSAYLLGLSQEAPDFTLPASKKDVASFLGLQPESLSRALGALKTRGAIEVSDAEVTIRDRAALERFLAGG